MFRGSSCETAVEPPIWRATPFRTPAPTYSIYSQLPFLSVGFSPPPATGEHAMLWSQGKGHPTTGYEGPEGDKEIALPFLWPRRWEWVVSTTIRPHCPRERDPVPNVQEAQWAPEKLVLSEIRSPDRPTRNKSLYRLSYPGPSWWQGPTWHGFTTQTYRYIL
jgi:hypothetical protein